MIGLAEVRRAREVVTGHIRRTPLVDSPELAAAIGTAAYLKAECLKRTGSFKPRGATNAMLTMSPADRGRGVVTMSAGNAAAAIAYSGRELGVPVTVVMPKTAPRMKVDAARSFGAEVRFADDMTQLLPIVRSLEAEGWRFLHPFDDDAMIAGHGSLALEVLEDVPDADVIVVGVGGGGLIAGIAAAATAVRPGIRVIGVEPEGAPAMRRALDAGHPVTMERVETVADALAAPFAGDRPFEIVRRCVDDVVLVPDGVILEGVRFLAGRAKLVAEPGGAAATGALLAGAVRVGPGERVVSVVSGGNVDPERLAAILAQ